MDGKGFSLSAELEEARKKFENDRATGGRSVRALKHARPIGSRTGSMGSGSKLKKDLKEATKRMERQKQEARYEKMKQKSSLYERLKSEDHHEDDMGGLIMPNTGTEGSDSEIEIVDEFGRTRMVPRSKALLYQSGEEPVDRPANLISGNFIQNHAIQTRTGTGPPSDLSKQAAAIKNRLDELDRRQEHYDASWELRDKGVGFYQFSHDEDVRAKEMQSLKHMSTAVTSDRQRGRQDLPYLTNEANESQQPRDQQIESPDAKKHARKEKILSLRATNLARIGK
uniref:ARAD1C00836p n=1 Tax=Blastobotrys adeninivorans TaxID=409370 RepID=A0A060SZH7_BLAAD